MFLSTFHFHLLFLPLLPMGCCVVCSWIQCWFARYVFCGGWRWFIEVALPSSSSSWEDGPTRGRVGSAACLCLSRQFDFDKDPRDTSTQGAEITRFYLYPSPERDTHTHGESANECDDILHIQEGDMKENGSIIYGHSRFYSIKRNWAPLLNNDLPEYCTLTTIRVGKCRDHKSLLLFFARGHVHDINKWD